MFVYTLDPTQFKSTIIVLFLPRYVSDSIYETVLQHSD